MTLGSVIFKWISVVTNWTATLKHRRDVSQAHLSGQLYFQEPTSMLPPLALQEYVDMQKSGESQQF